MEAVLGRAGQVQWALAATGHLGKKSCSSGNLQRCGSFGVERRWRSNPGVVRYKRAEVLKVVRAVSAEGGGGNGEERFGRGGGNGGGNGGDNGRNDSSDGDDDAGGRAPEAASGILAWLEYSELTLLPLSVTLILYALVQMKGTSNAPKYMDQTNRHPVTTKAITAAILNLLGDVFCQLVINKSEKVDIKRTAVITFLGFILVGPTLHTWYLTLSKVVTATGFTGAGIQLVLDQFLFSPAFVALFFASLLTLEGRPKDIVPKLKQDWKPTVIANWKLWIPFQFVNFLFVPQQLRVAFANVVALAWNVYLSFASHKEVAVAIPSATVDMEMSPFDDEK